MSEHPKKLPPILLLFPLLLITPAYAAESSRCSVEGERIHWIADYCMAQFGTDDEIAVSDCINGELDRSFTDDCTAKRHYKRALCELALARETMAGTVESCVADKAFMGSTAENKGVGD